MLPKTNHLNNLVISYQSNHKIKNNNHNIPKTPLYSQQSFVIIYRSRIHISHSGTRR